MTCLIAHHHGCNVQVLGLVKDVQAKSGKLYKDWLK